MIEGVGRDDEWCKASDTARRAIGSDLVWSQITAWIAGAIDYDEFAASIDGAFAANEP